MPFGSVVAERSPPDPHATSRPIFPHRAGNAMAPTSRRRFLQSVEAFALLPSLQTIPELILYRTNIITIDARQPRARAVAIADGRFLAVGDDVEVRSLAGPRTDQVDLEGRTVVPGFIDAHAHPAS